MCSSPTQIFNFLKAQELGNAKRHVMELAATMNAERIGRNHWCDKEEYQRLQLKGSSLFLVGGTDYFWVCTRPYVYIDISVFFYKILKFN
jgi:hypothetical protein